MSSKSDEICHRKLNDSDGEVAPFKWPCVWCIKNHMAGEGNVGNESVFKQHGEIKSIRSIL
jgi:hypothetical protein